eukprot:scaffold913_cov137-Skeletonema_dohrnii-CCMP3373.AAC.14
MEKGMRMTNNGGKEVVPAKKSCPFFCPYFSLLFPLSRPPAHTALKGRINNINTVVVLSGHKLNQRKD